MPFNLRHRRFPITYELDDAFTVDRRKEVRKTLTQSLEKALGDIFKSEEFKRDAKPARPMKALELAALHRKDVDHQNALEALQFNFAGGQQWARNLIETIEARCREVQSRHRLHFEFAGKWENETAPYFVARVTPQLGLHVSWNQPSPGSLKDAKVSIGEYQGRLVLPGEPFPQMPNPPRKTSEVSYEPTLARGGGFGWVKVGREDKEPEFISPDDLADYCVCRLIELLRR